MALSHTEDFQVGLAEELGVGRSRRTKSEGLKRGSPLVLHDKALGVCPRGASARAAAVGGLLALLLAQIDRVGHVAARDEGGASGMGARRSLA
jgi:hypothetical protein